MTALFKPFKLRSLEIKNRIALSPMQQYSAVDGLPGQWHLVHLGSRAVGGAGLIITECTAVSEHGRNTLFDVGLWNKHQLNAWKPIVQFVQEQGSKIAVQLWHAGGKGSSSHPNEGMKPLTPDKGGWITKSASATTIGFQQPEAMSIDEIHLVKRDFVEAAKNAVRAGFDAIELHAAHGYLFHQFYSKLINKRTDGYGGSFANRIRILVETVQEVRSVIPKGMPLLTRISAVDYENSPDGWSLEDSVKLVKILKENDVDLITASGGGFVHVDPKIVKPNYQLHLATEIKKQTGMMVGTVGMITSPQQANEIIEKEHAEIVVIAREHLRNPYFSINAAIELGEAPTIPWLYQRAYSHLKF
ncbi:NADH:flavin oxidoreductase/NADH oxidase [Arenibacter sp. NBRC 103722]|uniref:NADH:flavin oxidoreductase/NADH oxidase n=1 Tax=Arenibacter sp. NBRC 103722 TaxID=1113929 RepID=UPI000852D5E3|nr:NADH:flavin oxidoreductase/NADH oxidase [Arenibacter sp. NBRC 103722]